MVKTFSWYPAEDQKRSVRTKKQNKTRLRKGVEEGSVLILTAGKYRGHRVVFLKQLESGLMLVSGPFKVNGVPLKRVNQAYTIVTSTKVPVKGLKLDGLNDALFKDKSSKSKGRDIFNENQKKTVSADRAAAQKKVDDQLMTALKAVKTPMTEYLRARFSLSKNDRPHAMKF